MQAMRRKADIRATLETPVMGFAIVLLSIVCFLILLWILIAAVRVVMG